MYILLSLQMRNSKTVETNLKSININKLDLEFEVSFAYDVVLGDLCLSDVDFGNISYQATRAGVNRSYQSMK